MLKLTTMNGDVIYVAARYIVSMFRDLPDRTRIYSVEFSADQWVKESPEDILAMPEMAYALNPAYVISSPNPLSQI